MKKLFLLIAFVAVTANTYAQSNGFDYGKISRDDLSLTVYTKDSSASAVYLKEFGEGYVDLQNMGKIVLEYHAVIKVLNTHGLKWADFEIPLRRSEGSEDALRSVKATAYNLENNSIVSTHLEYKNIISDKANPNLYYKKFAVPNVKVGSVIEVQYSIESPFVYNFWTWTFQADIPKINSEFWATYPAFYKYNITFRGSKRLDKNDQKALKNCIGEDNVVATARADCFRMQLGMNNVPAFHEEEYMTARSNFVSAVYFELATIHYYDGSLKRFTQEWKDVDNELRKREDFGAQIRKGRDVVEDDVKKLIAGKVDPLEKAKSVYKFIQAKMHWDDRTGIFTHEGVKKAYEEGKGRVPEINLLLASALQVAGLESDPVLLSTRDNGLPVEVHPVISSFNYVAVRVTIGGQSYLLDATEPALPFGILPLRCINGKGRVMAKESFWTDLKATHKIKQTTTVALKLENNGMVTGAVRNEYSGYAAIDIRAKISSFDNIKSYVADVTRRIGDQSEMQITT
jgi:hypothetical protein